MSHKILIADASTTIHRIVELAFATQPIEVLTAADGAEAIEQALASRPDVILADVAMPRIGGGDLAALVKGHPSLWHTRVLLLTSAFDRAGDHLRSATTHCDGLIIKPFEPRDLVARVRELLAAGIERPFVSLGRPHVAGFLEGADDESGATDEHGGAAEEASNAKDRAPEEDIETIISTLRTTSAAPRPGSASTEASRGPGSGQTASEGTVDGGLALWREAPRSERVSSSQANGGDTEAEEITTRVLARLAQLTLGELVERLSAVPQTRPDTKDGNSRENAPTPRTRRA